MPVIAVIGGQWGDEGKGHIVDYLARQARLVIRYGGGSNAGHTVTNEHGVFKLHLIPSGIFDPNTINVIAHGVIVDPATLLEEIAGLHERNISTAQLFVSDRAHVVLPYHILQDQLQEQARGEGKIGTTGRGIGPACVDKTDRIGLRMGDLLYDEVLLERLRAVLEEKNRILTRLYGVKAFQIYDLYLRLLEYGSKLADYITDVHVIIHRALDKDLPILLEGAQGALLDLDHGTYPYVTSSSPGAAGACQGAGIGPTRINSVIGVFKAYATRVGEGPFPTELQSDSAEATVLRQMGTPWAEVGTTTGRQRRVGWFDAVLARYVTEVNGIDTIALTKLDVLDTLERIKMCVAYKRHDEVLEYPPISPTQLSKVEPVYEEFRGWQCPTSDVRSFHDLPEEAQAYIARICQITGARLGIVSVGPNRDQIIPVENIF